MGRSAFTIVELLICVGVVSLLVAFLLPALGATREVARRAQCSNHLRQMGLAIHAYHDSYQCLPAGWKWDQEKVTAFGWLPHLLPFLEQTELHRLVQFESSVGSDANAQARSRTLPLFLCPSDFSAPNFMLYVEPVNTATTADVPLFQLPAANYVGVFGIREPDDVWQFDSGRGAFSGTKPVRFQQMNRGLSVQFIVGERRMSTIPSTWLGIDVRGEDAHCRILGNANLGPNLQIADECEFTSRHPGMTNFLWADGHVSVVSDSIFPQTYQQMAVCDQF